MTSSKSRVAIVTGSGSGIGQGIALAMAREGIKVAVIDHAIDRVEATVKEIQNLGGECLGLTIDVSNSSQVQELNKAILSKWGRIDILVNNAGILRDNFISKITEEDWDKVIDVNLKSVFLCSKAVITTLKEQKYGRIVNISSIAYLGNMGQANYSAAKGGIVSLTKTMALELARHGITVNAVAPGLIDTPLVRSLCPEVADRIRKAIPCGQWGEVADIVNAVNFLVSPECRYLTGQVLHVDGGISVGFRN